MRLAVLGGDGIGAEVTREALRVLQVVAKLHRPLEFELCYGEIGLGAFEKYKTPLPEATLEMARTADATLFGAVTTPPDIAGYRSPILSLRQKLGLYANVRPIRSRPGTRPGIDMVIVRENTEGLYAGRERSSHDEAVTERVITRSASERIVRYALELSRARGDRRVTLVHKANVLRETCGLFRRVGREVATHYPEIELEDMLVDTCAMELIRAPERFSVIVTTNLFGDILSDEACMLVGGLGLAASGNIGDRAGLFEPVHGSAPDLQSTGCANPLAAILSLAMALEHVDRTDLAALVEGAVDRALDAGSVTPDLGGKLSTREATDALIAEIEAAA